MGALASPQDYKIYIRNTICIILEGEIFFVLHTSVYSSPHP